MGVGVFARLQHAPGIRQWDPRAENWVPICASIWDRYPRLGPASPGGSYLEMGGVCLSVRLGTCTRACRRARIAAPFLLGQLHRLSKKQPLTELCCKTDARGGGGGRRPP